MKLKLVSRIYTKMLKFESKLNFHKSEKVYLQKVQRSEFNNAFMNFQILENFK